MSDPKAYLTPIIPEFMKHTKPRFNYFKAPDLNHKGRHVVFYCEWGDIKNSNVIICVHGLSRNSRDFDFLADTLAQKFRVICIDIAGRGKSEWLHNKSLYDYETYVSDVISLLDSLGIRKIDWIGTSMGGIIGMIVASRYPHLVHRLVLNDIGPVIPGPAIERIMHYVGASYDFHNRTEAERALRERMATFGIKKEEHWQHVIQHSITRKLNGMYTFAYDPEIIPKITLLTWLKKIIRKIISRTRNTDTGDVDLFDIWEKITCPILALRGKESDIVTDAILAQMKESKDAIKIVEFESTGHAPMLMEESQIEIIKKWLLKK